MPVTTKNHDIFEHLTSDSRHDARYERMRRKAKAFLAIIVKDELEPLMAAMYEEAEDEIPTRPTGRRWSSCLIKQGSDYASELG